MSYTIDAKDFRIERPNEVARRFDRATLEITDERLLIVTDSDDGSVLAIYNDGYWEAVIFGASDS